MLAQCRTGLVAARDGPPSGMTTAAGGVDRSGVGDRLLQPGYDDAMTLEHGRVETVEAGPSSRCHGGTVPALGQDGGGRGLGPRNPATRSNQSR